MEFSGMGGPKRGMFRDRVTATLIKIIIRMLSYRQTNKNDLKMNHFETEQD